VADDEGNFYLNVGSDASYAQAFTFSIERNGVSVAMTGSNIVYEADAVIGRPDNPETINFGNVDPQSLEEGKWYTLTGIELPGKPQQPGFYIYNGNILKIK